MPHKTYQEQEKAILAEEKAMIARASDERALSIQNARQIEQELSRRSLEAVDKLREKLKGAGTAQEKTELKEAVKEAEAAAKQAIGRARQNSQRLITGARQKEKEEIKKAEEARKAAIKSLKEKGAPSKLEVGKPKPDTTTGNAGTPETASVEVEQGTETAGVQGAQLDQSSQTAQEQKQPAPAANGDLKYSGYESIRKALEETAKKLEAARHTRLSDEASTPAFDGEMATTRQDQAKLPQADTYPDKQDKTSSGKLQKKNNKKEKADAEVLEEPFVLTREKIEMMFSGQVQIIIENPSSAGSMRSLGEKLKQVQGLRIMLFGGSADEGVQIVVNAIEPVRLVPKIQEITEMEIVNVNQDEIRLRVIKSQD